MPAVLADRYRGNEKQRFYDGCTGETNEQT